MAYDLQIYSQIQALIRVEGQAKGQPPPHADLANMGNGLEAQQHFIRRWNKLFQMGTDKGQRTFLSDEEFYALQVPLVPFRDLLRRAWHGDSGAVKDMRREVEQDIRATIRFDNRQFQIKIEGFIPVVMGLFLLDYDAGRTAVCANFDSGCVAPYFVKRRSSDKYCGSDWCAREAQRKYLRDTWARHGKKWRKRRKKSGKAV